MGIHDRDYARREPPGGGYAGRGMRSMRMWSANTWLIVTCIAVFVIDGFTGLHPVEMGLSWDARLSDEAVRSIDPSALRLGPIEVTRRDSRTNRPREGYRLVTTAETGNQVLGRQEVIFMPLLEKYLHFSTKRGILDLQYWRLIGFQFLHTHDTLAHLLFNMVGLFFFGSLVEQYLGSKRYLAFYLLCGIFGALMYVILNLGGYVIQARGLGTIPGLLFNDLRTPLIGASAGVFGVLMAGAKLAPDARVLLLFIIPMRLRTLAYGLVALAVFTLLIGGSNAGGEAGHLGGAIAGFYFIRHPHHLHGFFDILGRVDPTSHHYRKGGGVSARARATARIRGGGPSRTEVDRVLDKVHAQGLSSLTEEEKRVLSEASKR